MTRFWLTAIPLTLLASLFVSRWFLWLLAAAGAASFLYRMALRAYRK